MRLQKHVRREAPHRKQKSYKHKKSRRGRGHNALHERTQAGCIDAVDALRKAVKISDCVNDAESSVIALDQFVAARFERGYKRRTVFARAIELRNLLLHLPRVDAALLSPKTLPGLGTPGRTRAGGPCPPGYACDFVQLE